MRTIYVALLIILLCASCREEYDHKGKTPLVSVEGNFLYREDLQPLLPLGLSQEDSLAFVQRYIRNWVEEILLYEKAKSNIPDGEGLNLQVENYRKALVMHAYQQALIRQKLSEEVSEAELLDYYHKNQALFRVDRPLMKGLFIKVPLKVPQLSNVRQWYRMEDRAVVEKLEKYSLQHAVKYEYFYDRWRPVAEVLDLLPSKKQNMEVFLNEKRHVEMKDSAFYYFLNVTDFLPIGEQAPYDFARNRIKDMLFNAKQVQYMKEVREDLYQCAMEKNKIEYY